MRASIPLGAASVRDKKPFQMLGDPLCGFAVPFRRDRAFFLLPCHQSCQRGRQLAGIGHNEFVRPIVMVSGRSVLSRSARTGRLLWFVWFIWSIWLV